MSHPSNALRINAVVLRMCAKKPDHQNACLILYCRDQPKVVIFDVEYDTPTFENTCLRVRRLYFLRISPPSLARNGEPDVILRTRRLNPSVASTVREIAFDEAHTEHDHQLFFGMKFQKLEDVRLC